MKIDQKTLYTLICIAFAFPINGQSAPMISDIEWGSEECFLSALGQAHAMQSCYASGAVVEQYSDGHLRLSKRSTIRFGLDTFHGRPNHNDTLAEKAFSKFANIAHVCATDISCDLPQEVSAFLSNGGKCSGRIFLYDLYDYFEELDEPMEHHRVGSLAVCTSEDAAIWLYQWDAVGRAPFNRDGTITYIIDRE